MLINWKRANNIQILKPGVRKVSILDQNLCCMLISGKVQKIQGNGYLERKKFINNTGICRKKKQCGLFIPVAPESNLHCITQKANKKVKNMASIEGNQ